MAKRNLPTLSPEKEGLGAPTIMDRELAAKHGAKYVHLTAFAIDVDRVRDEVEQEWTDPDWPFGWEVLLTERCLLDALDPTDPSDQELIEDMVESARRSAGEHEGEVFGGQLPFAVYDAIARGVWPDSLRGLFAEWKETPDELVEDLAAMWGSAGLIERLSAACLTVDLPTPLAPPTRERLGELR